LKLLQESGEEEIKEYYGGGEFNVIYLIHFVRTCANTTMYTYSAQP
jgi:hypothetical protein